MLYCPCGLCAVGAFSSVFSSQGVRGNIEALVDSVLAPYQITRGTLPSVASGNDDDNDDDNPGGGGGEGGDDPYNYGDD